MKESKEIAKNCTTRAASLKDWRITNKCTRAAREAARELLEQGGYFIGTLDEAAAKWPGIVKVTGNGSASQIVFLWAFDLTLRRWPYADIDLVPISAEGQR